MNSVEQALAALRRVEPGLVDHARAAWDHLTGGAGPEVVTQWRVQQFCWDELARRWAGDPVTRWRVALALAALLDSLGLERYAELARSETTRLIVMAGDQARARGRKAADRAAERSGIEPPDTELLTWGAVMGPLEARAMEAVANRLELAVVAGHLQPGGRGWRDQQADITIDVLTSPQQGDLRALYEQVLDERLDHWIRSARSTTRSGLLAPLETMLREPVEPGLAAPARALLRPLDWLLTEIGDGVALTAAGYLPPRTVARALDDLGWREELIGPANREVDAYPVMILRETAQRLGLLRRRGPRLLLSPGGRAALEDGRLLWQSVAAGLVGPEHTAQAVAWEVVLAVLESGDRIQEQDARQLVQAVVSESGWRLAGRREPAESDTSALFFAVLGELRWLELVQETGALMDRQIVAKPGAGALFRAALRNRVLHRDIVAL